MAAATPLSKSQINRAGDYLAEAVGMADADFVEWYDFKRNREARKIVSDYRAAHQRPLGNLSQGLRQIVRIETGENPLVSQRLKRVPRILRKLSRMGHSGLARLEDIGGCRAVLPDGDALDRVKAHVERTWETIIVARRRVVQEPTAMGYRACHLTVLKFDRRIELQLRTQGQQEWADSIEATDSFHNLTLKDGVSPDSLRDYYCGASDMIYSQEYGRPLDPQSRERFEVARDLVIEQGYFRGKGE